jgi:uncharacterized membrane protein
MAMVRLTVPGRQEDLVGEPRWPPLVALLVFLALNVGLRLWLPGEVLVGVPWLLPTIEFLLLIVLFTGNPSSLTKPRRWARPLALGVVVLLVAGALWATVLLVYHLITGAEVTESSGMLLAAASLVYVGNNVSFALLYWLLDSGGPLARARRDDRYRDYAFTQHMSPELAPPGWQPVFADYLHLGFTNATAFSPTDVMPLTLRAKYTMVVHSTVALALFGLVVARAVNAFA